MLVNSCQIDKLLKNGSTSNPEAPPPPQPPSPPPPPPAPGVLEVSPASLKDSALVGTREVRRSTIQITNTGRWTVQSDSEWIAVTPTTGIGLRFVTIVLNPDGLRAGSHEGAVIVSATNAAGSPVTVPVKFVLQQPVLSVRPSSITHSTQSNNRRYFDTLDVRNDGSGPLAWTASNSSNWLGVTTKSGAGPGKLAITMSTAGLPVGTFVDTIVVVAPGADRSPARIRVELRRKRD